MPAVFSKNSTTTTCPLQPWQLHPAAAFKALSLMAAAGPNELMQLLDAGNAFDFDPQKKCHRALYELAITVIFRVRQVRRQYFKRHGTNLGAIVIVAAAVPPMGGKDTFFKILMDLSRKFRLKCVSINADATTCKTKQKIMEADLRRLFNENDSQIIIWNQNANLAKVGQVSELIHAETKSQNGLFVIAPTSDATMPDGDALRTSPEALKRQKARIPKGLVVTTCVASKSCDFPTSTLDPTTESGQEALQSFVDTANHTTRPVLRKALEANVTQMSKKRKLLKWLKSGPETKHFGSKTPEVNNELQKVNSHTKDMLMKSF